MSAVEYRYAEALLGVATSHEIANKTGELLLNLSDLMTKNDDLRDFLLNPTISGIVKKDTVRKILTGDIIPDFLNFIFLLVDKERLSSLSVIYDEYKRLKNVRYKNIDIHVYSALPLEERQIVEICEKYRKIYGAVSAEVHHHIDSSLLGGIRIQIGDIYIDNTLSGKLKNLHSILAI